MSSVTSAHSVSDLVAAAGGGRITFVFFWSHSSHGASGDGHRFTTAEQYMMWRKAVLFGDDEVAAQILSAGGPGAVKDLGRRVRGFDEEVWEREHFGIVVDGSVAKSGQDPELRDHLLATSNRVLVEASPRDRLWGIGLAADDEAAQVPSHWRGLNLLGFALMEARERLGAGPANAEAGERLRSRGGSENASTQQILDQVQRSRR